MSVDRMICIEICCDTCADVYRADGVDRLSKREAAQEDRKYGWWVGSDGSATCPRCRGEETTT